MDTCCVYEHLNHHRLHRTYYFISSPSSCHNVIVMSVSVNSTFASVPNLQEILQMQIENIQKMYILWG